MTSMHLFRTVLFSFVLFLGTVMVSCSSEEDCPSCFTPPEDIILQFQDSASASDLFYSERYAIGSLAVFYYTSMTDTAHLSLVIFNDTAACRYQILCSELSWLSSEGVKSFYISYNETDMDTISLDVERKEADCCTFFECNSFTINGVEPEVDSVTYNRIYTK